VEDRTQDPLGEHVITSCAKLNLLDKLLPRLQARGSRVLVFSQVRSRVRTRETSTRRIERVHPLCLS